MLLASGKGRVPFAAMLFRHPSHLVDAANVHDCGQCPLLLIGIGNAVMQGLDCDAVSLAHLKVSHWLIIVVSDFDRVPRAISAVSHQ